jgi:hypothetical protein
MAGPPSNCRCSAPTSSCSSRRARSARGHRQPTWGIERLYSYSGVPNAGGRCDYSGRVGGCLITGNEDSIEHIAMGTLYALQHLGLAIRPQADAGWIGEVGPGTSYGDELDDGTLSHHRPSRPASPLHGHSPVKEYETQPGPSEPGKARNPEPETVRRAHQS